MDAERVRLVAAARYLHDGRLVHPGMEITAGEAEAADLCALGFARRAEDEMKPKPKPKQKPEAVPVVKKKPRKAGYKRRDMRAENS